MDKEKFHQYLAVFELEPDASLEDVKIAYRELCLIWHPDKNPSRVSARVTRKLQLLNEAYQWLTQHTELWENSQSLTKHQPRQHSPTVMGLQSKERWWHQLDQTWRRIFQTALGLIRPLNDQDVEHILALPEIDCGNAVIQNLLPLQQLQCLERLACDNTEITDLSPLENLTNLRVLECWNTPIKSLASLQNLTSLQRLNCNETLIDDLQPLRNLAHLQQLSCSETNVRSLAPLENLRNLQHLSCGETRIQSLEPLKNLKQLRILYCSHTRINSIAPLRELPHLQALYCEETNVSLYELGRFRTEFPQCKVLY